MIRILLFLALPSLLLAQTRQMELRLPTPNSALFSTDQSNFYMYTDRTFEGKSSRPWTAGKYGYVRNPKRHSSGLIYTRFHEGIDIAPVARDSRGNPTDTVRSMDHGRVVYVNPVSSRSSYGKYVVVEHNWGEGPFYSLYAHLSFPSVKVGQKVAPGSALGRLGYTGTGLNQRRAHVHVELNFKFSSRFTKWHGKYFRTPNHHGNYNGINLAGIDLASLLRAHRSNKTLSMSQFVARMSPYYKITVPNKGTPELLRNYPWLLKGGTGSASWQITFSRSGIPLAITKSPNRVSKAQVSWVKPSSSPHSWNTRSRLSGSGSSATLTSSGARFVQLVTGQF